VHQPTDVAYHLRDSLALSLVGPGSLNHLPDGDTDVEDLHHDISHRGDCIPYQRVTCD
jgi:hypothetical protein